MLKVANSVINASQITGVLPVVNGGTGVTTSTGTGNTVLSAGPTFTGTAVFSAIGGGTSGTGYSFSGSAPAGSLSLNSSGNVGIGTTTPAYKLEVATGTTGQQSLANFRTADTTTANNAGIQIFATPSSTATSRSTYMMWDADGANAGGADYFYIQKLGNSGQVDFIQQSVAAMTFQTSGAERMRIDPSGIVTMNAYGAGAATFSSAGVISSVSDETWKVKDGVPTDPDAMLKKLKPGYWFYNDEKKETFGSDRQLGFYAQNVNAAIGPEAAPTPETITTKNKEGIETTVTKPWGYYDRSVLAVTVMSLQKALKTIELLTARVAVLEAK